MKECFEMTFLCKCSRRKFVNSTTRPLPFTSLCRLIVDDAAAALVDSELVPILKTMLSSDKTQLEILCNTLTLARNVAVSSKFPQSYCSLHQA